MSPALAGRGWRPDEAGTAAVSVTDDITVTVATRETVGTIFAGMVGINSVDIGADATAVCGVTQGDEPGFWQSEALWNSIEGREK